NELDLARAHTRVDVHDPGIKRRESEEEGDHRGAVLADEHHAVSGAHAEGFETTRKMDTRALELAPRPRALAFAKHDRIGTAFGPLRGDFLEPLQHLCRRFRRDARARRRARRTSRG